MTQSARTAFAPARLFTPDQAWDAVCLGYRDIKFKTEPDNRAGVAIELIKSKPFNVVDFNHVQGAADIALGLMEATPMADRAPLHAAIISRPTSDRLAGIYPRAADWYRASYDEVLETQQNPARAAWQEKWQAVKPLLDAPNQTQGSLKAGIDRVFVNTAVEAFKDPAFRTIQDTAPWSALDVRMAVGERLKPKISDHEFQRYMGLYVFGSTDYQTVRAESPVVALHYVDRGIRVLGYKPDDTPGAKPGAQPA